MARSHPRLAAGVGVVSLCLLLGGPAAAVVSADPGNGHSDRGNNSSKSGNGYSRGNSQSRGADNDGTAGRVTTSNSNGSGNGGNHHADDSADVADDIATPKVRVGSGRDDQQWLSPGGEPAQDSAITAVEPGPNGASGGTGPGEVSGPEAPGATGRGFQSPRVTFGNGRIPGVDTDDPEPDWQGPSSHWQPDNPPPAPPAPPPPPAPPSWVDRIATHPAPTMQIGVAPAADLSDPLWGVAGLLLIPAAGAVLGYRQARASQAAERIRRG